MKIIFNKLETILCLLTIFVCILKCVGFIDIPWVWLLSPIWIQLCILIVSIAFMLFISMIRSIFDLSSND